MAEDLTILKSAEELEEQLGTAFRSGDIGQTAFITWELMNRFPDKAGVARVYAKKILRDSTISSLAVEDVLSNVAKIKREPKVDVVDVAQLCAIGLLLFPANRDITLQLVAVLDQLDRIDLAALALEALGEPKDDDVLLLNAKAALAQREGDYQSAFHIFKRLRLLMPDHEEIATNLSAALMKLKRYDEAASLLESFVGKAKEPKAFIARLIQVYGARNDDIAARLLALDQTYFLACSSAATSRAHADINLFLEDFEQVEIGLQACVNFQDNPVTQFEIAEVQLTQGKLDLALESYKVRFKAFPHLRYCEPKALPYTGQILEDETLFIWSEQGIGDELLFSCFYGELQKRVSNVVVAMDPRTAAPLEREYPDWKFVNRYEVSENCPVTDYACPTGDLFIHFLPSLLASGERVKQPLFRPDPVRLQKILAILGTKTRPRVGISWRGGGQANGEIRSLELSKFMAGLDEHAEIDIISFQYDKDHQKEVLEYGDRRVALSGLNNRDDLEGVFCLLSQCDVVITVDNAVAHFSALMGVPTIVLIPAGQTQFRWKSPHIKNLIFPRVKLCRQAVPGCWTEAVQEGWSAALNSCYNGKEVWQC